MTTCSFASRSFVARANACAALALAVPMGCGSTSRSAPGPEAASTARAGEVAEEDCAGSDADREAVCIARGCQWGPVPSCGEGAARSDGTRPRCACTCEADLETCGEQDGTGAP